MIHKDNNAYKSIGEVAKILNLVNMKKGTLNTHTIRFWEKKFKARLDPRLYNGAIFIGLDSPVIKSHGGTDYIGFSNSLSVCTKTVSGNLIEKIRNNII